MTLNDIIDFANTLFDEPTNGKFMRDGGSLARRIGNMGYAELCRETKCSVASKAEILTQNKYGPYSLPSEAVVLMRLDIGEAGQAPNTKLPRGRLNDFDFSRADAMPTKYALEGAQLFFSPAPDAAYPYKLHYAQGPTADIGGTAAPELIPAPWHYVLAYYIVFQYMKIDKGDASGSTPKWQAIYENELAKMKHYFAEGVSADYYIGSRAAAD